jgi:protein TonB
VLLHALVALALWWMMLNRPTLSPAEEPVEVTFEQPKPPKPPEPPPPAPPKQVPLPQSLPEPLALMPEAKITAEKRTQVPTAPVRPNEAPAPLPPAQADKPQPFAFSPAPSAPPGQRPPSPSPPEAAARPPAEPTTPFSSPLPAPTLPTPILPPANPLSPPLPTPPETHALLAPPLPRASPAPQRPDARPAPPTTAPTQRPAARAPSEPPSTSPFVNPADTYNRAKVADNYLWQIVHRLEGYRYEAHVAANQGITVVRVTIARDGRLLDVDIARSSGVPEFDRGVLAGVRAGSPYDPLPPDIQGDRATFTLSLVSVKR